MLPPEYVWITPGWYPEHWWMEEASLNCTLDARRRILNLSLSVVPEGSFVSSNSTLTASSGMVTDLFTAHTYMYILSQLLDSRNLQRTICTKAERH